METGYVALATYVYSLQAFLIQQKLEAEGIEVQMNPALSGTDKGVTLFVKQGQFEAARRKLDQISLESNLSMLEHEPQIKKILVPVDFSSQTSQVCQYAIELADRFQAEILILHACYIPSLDAALLSEASVYSVTLDEHLHNLEIGAQANLNKLMNELETKLAEQGLTHLKLTQRMVKGFADDEIYIVYQEYEPDLIIMGNSSRGIKSHKLYGSVTSEVIDNVLVPVLVAPSKPAKINLNSIQSILYLTDFDNTDYRAIHKLIYLVSPFNLKIHVVHLNGTSFGDWNTLKLEGLKERLHKEFLGFNIQTDMITDENPLERLDAYIQEHHIDMLSMVTHKRNFISRLFKSNLTEKLLFNSTRPMLIFH